MQSHQRRPYCCGTRILPIEVHSCSTSTGLVRNASKPASSARRRSSGRAKAVNAMMGTCASGGAALPEGAEQVVAVALWKADVGQDDVRRFARQQFQRSGHGGHAAAAGALGP